VRPATAREAIPLLTWTTVERLVAARAEMMVIRNGVRRPGPQPLTLLEARGLLERGYSLVIRGCDRTEPGLRELAERFERDLPGDVGVQAFVTPAGYCSLGWHYDCEDVFIAQTSGQKQYRMRRNTVNPRPRLDALPRDPRFERETSPVLACTLLPGDWLYVPRGWWHMAYATRDSLSLAVGVLTPEARGTAPRPDAAERRGRRRETVVRH
jgi:ribosomal protein L16 Arg81 hydroxylase